MGAHPSLIKHIFLVLYASKKTSYNLLQYCSEKTLHTFIIMQCDVTVSCQLVLARSAPALALIIVCPHSLLCKNNLNNFAILHDMHMGLESLESPLKSASFDISIAHVELENNTLQWHSLIINTFIGPVFTMEELAFHTINTFYF